MLALGLTACTTSTGASAASLVVTPASSGADAPVTLRVQGMAAGTAAQVSVSSTDAGGLVWSASAPFSVGSDGSLRRADSRTSAPETSSVGTRSGDVASDATSLVATMQPPPGAASTPGAFYAWGQSAATFTWSVKAGDQSATTATSRSQGPGGLAVQHLLQAKDGVAGTFAAMPGGGRHPAVLALGGSEGGDQSGLAIALAARGIPTLAQAYFKEPGLPATVSRIPLETFDHGLDWLRARPEVDPDRIWVIGGSYGSEAALLVGIRRPDVHGVVVTSPGNIVSEDYPPTGNAAWTAGGTPLPFTSEVGNPAPTDVPAAVIPVEKITRPVVAVCGGADTLWPSCRQAQAIMTRLDAAPTQHPHELWTYPLAGHWVDVLLPYLPARADEYKYGRSQVDDDAARAQVWPRLVSLITGATS